MCVLVIAVFTSALIFTDAERSQESPKRFAKIKEWKITFSISCNRIDTTEPVSALIEDLRRNDPDWLKPPSQNGEPTVDSVLESLIFFSNLIESFAQKLNIDSLISISRTNNAAYGSAMLGNRESDFGAVTWYGSGSCSFAIAESSIWKDVAHGTFSFKSVDGAGKTKIDAESMLDIEFASNVYHLSLMPGGARMKGMKVELFETNNFWGDFGEKIRPLLKREGVMPADEVDEVFEVMGPRRETDDAYYHMTTDTLQVFVEDIPLPASGMVLEGTRNLNNGTVVSWKIVPAQ